MYIYRQYFADMSYIWIFASLQKYFADIGNIDLFVLNPPTRLPQNNGFKGGARGG